MDHERSWVRLDLVGGEAYYLAGFLTQSRADELFETLRRQVSWHQPQVRLYGRTIASPRLAAWYADPGVVYTYSGASNEPIPWLPELQALRDCVQRTCGARFNGMLANLYRDGQDSVGWHSDDESELGRDPVIASLSLGGARRFVMRHRKRKTHPVVSVILEHGSLLWMCGATQHHWRHRVPATRRAVPPRINLTFRYVRSAPHS